jgi:hypothetical protein
MIECPIVGARCDDDDLLADDDDARVDGRYCFLDFLQQPSALLAHVRKLARLLSVFWSKEILSSLLRVFGRLFFLCVSGKP